MPHTYSDEMVRWAVENPDPTLRDDLAAYEGWAYLDPDAVLAAFDRADLAGLGESIVSDSLTNEAAMNQARADAGYELAERVGAEDARRQR